MEQRHKKHAVHTTLLFVPLDQRQESLNLKFRQGGFESHREHYLGTVADEVIALV